MQYNNTMIEQKSKRIWGVVGCPTRGVKDSINRFHNISVKLFSLQLATRRIGRTSYSYVLSLCKNTKSGKNLLYEVHSFCGMWHVELTSTKLKFPPSIDGDKSGSARCNLKVKSVFWCYGGEKERAETANIVSRPCAAVHFLQSSARW